MKVSGIGRVIFWGGGNLWIGLAVDAVDAHAHHAIQLCVGFNGPVEFRTSAREPWTAYPGGALVRPGAPHEFRAPGQRVANILFEPETPLGRTLLERFDGGTIVPLHTHVRELAAAFDKGADDDQLIDDGRRGGFATSLISSLPMRGRMVRGFIVLRSSFPEARRLTNELNQAAGRGQIFEKAGRLAERDATLQMVLDGGVLRQRFLPDGSRQTVAVYYRDDVINLIGYVGPRAEHSDYLMALPGTVVGEVPDPVVQELRAHTPDGMAVLVLHELRISHERIACLGQRSALERTAHFLCETMLRNNARGGGPANRCRLSLTQELLSSVLGMTTVHMNRTMRELKQRGLAYLSRTELLVPDFTALASVAQFDDAYLISY